MSKELRYLYTLLVFKSICACVIIYFSYISLSPDEAQYWTWSKDLSLGYYSKPPGVSWQIWLGCNLFGDTEFGVRFVSVILSACLSLAIYQLANNCGASRKVSLYSSVVMALCPVGIMSSFAATTDLGSILFLVLASGYVVRSIRLNRNPSYILVGLFIGLGALFKWTVFSIWPFIIIFSYLSIMRTKSMLLGILISLIGFIPSIIWNRTHDWATFRHVYYSNILGESRGNILEFFASQMAVLSPIIFILLLISFYQLKKYKSMEKHWLFCGFYCFVIVGLYLFAALFKKIQSNWVVYAYPMGIVFCVWVAIESIKFGKTLLKIGILLSVVLSIFVISVPYFQENSLFIKYPIPFQMNAFKHSLGWHRLGVALKESGYDSKKHFLFGDKYQIVSILSFYANQQKRAYFFNIKNSRLNQFSYWKSMTEEYMGTGFFVVVESGADVEDNFLHQCSHYNDILKHYFRKVEFITLHPLFSSYGKSVKMAMIFKCIDYNGKEPQKENKF